MNALLHALPESDRRKVCDNASRIEVYQYDNLQRAETPIAAAYFPETGWLSLLATFESGRTAEVGVVGNESMVGMELVFGGRTASFDWIVQGPGSLMRIEAALLLKLLDENPTIKAALVKATIRYHDQVAQTAACNALHTVDQRLARWLLLAHDRSKSDTVPLTHELLSMMLGARRAGVSVAAATLKTSGCIRYTRGAVTILNRAALEAASCECYQAVRRRCETLFS